VTGDANKENAPMGEVICNGTVSLDGYIAGPDGTGTEHLFAWFDAGDLELPSANPGVGPSIKLTEPDHRYMREVVDRIGVFVIGRRLFDIAAHPDAPFTFVTDGLASAIEQARAIAGDRNIEVTPGTIVSQCLELGLLDEVSFDLVPVLLGSGVPFFDQLKAAPILLDGPSLVVEGARVTHLRYRVRRS
jgi:dihydrofolate reductase